MTLPADIYELKDRIREAARTLRLLPGRIGPSLSLAYWPDVVTEASKTYSHHQAVEPHIVPSPVEIDEMDQVLRWLNYADREEQKIIWCWANGIPWRAVAHQIGVGERQAQNRFKSGLNRILGGIEKKTSYKPLQRLQKFGMVLR